jgi:hypothetical protein
MNHSRIGEPVLSSTPDGLQKEIQFEEKGNDRDPEATMMVENGRLTPESAQAGVKNIEAVSMTWSKWGLIAAYTRYLLFRNYWATYKFCLASF